MSATIQPDQLTQQLKWRYATKQFDPARKIAPPLWAALEEALLLTPFSFGLQPWKFIVINDPALRAKLRPVSWDQSQITDASHLVVFAAKSDLGERDLDEYLNRISAVRHAPLAALDGYRKMMAGPLLQGTDAAGRRAWAINQTYIALGNLLTTAAFMGIDACPMEGFDHAQYDAILGLRAKGLTAAVVATLGYRAAGDKSASLPKVRFLKEQVFIEM